MTTGRVVGRGSKTASFLPFDCSGLRRSKGNGRMQEYGAEAQRLRSVNDYTGNVAVDMEAQSWLSRTSYALKRVALAALSLLSATSALAQNAVLGPASPTPGLSLEWARSISSPVTDVFAYLILFLASAWQYIVLHPPVAVMLSAVIASSVAIVSIRSQRSITRLRETFVTLDRGNWDQDLIKARRDFAIIKKNLLDSKENIAKYSEMNDSEDYVTLQTIMNDYENLALGVRMSIIDEIYLCRWMRGAMIADWFTLSPLVTAYRHNHSSSTLYIEFEGIAAAWQRGRSYRTGRKLKPHHRRITVK